MCNHVFALFQYGLLMLSRHSCEELRQELLAGVILQILMVEPFAFLIIELRTRLAHAVERELLDELLHGENLLIGSGMPTE